MRPRTNSLLVVAPAWVGDMVMAQSLFKYLKRQQPERAVDVVASPAGFPLAGHMPEIRTAFCLPVRHGRLGLNARWRLARRLAEVGYNQAIVLPNSWKSALLPFLAAVPRRTGWRGEMRYGLLNDCRPVGARERQAMPLTVQRFLALADSPSGGAAEIADLTLRRLQEAGLLPELHISARQVEHVAVKFGLTKRKPLLGLCPGAAYGAAKRWPAEYFTELAVAAAGRGWQIVLFGSPAESEAGRSVEMKTTGNCINLIGKTDLSEATAALSLCRTVVSNDSGLMHVACALNVSVIAIFGSSSESRTPPLSPEAVVLSKSLDCRPCYGRTCPLGHYRCLRDIEPEQVLREPALSL